MVDEFVSGEVDHAPFNIAMLFYQDLNLLWVKKDDAYMNNDVVAWYKYLNRIFVKVQFKFTKDEYDAVYNILNDCKDRLRIDRKDPLIVDLLMSVDLMIIQLLNKYRMIFPNIEVTGGLKNLSNKYKLTNT